ncbi:hypothetical protein AB9K26_08150 [Psychroserpens sp. XS_ASV72]|uniref:hypothetical protein n=1 Tax=Psychroserpens sp. XS_ASV72 TaxID=3241293 RepID=UPI0035166BD3
MKRYLTFLFLFVLSSNTIIAQDLDTNSSTKVDLLIGNWKIDLRPTPESEAYYQFFVVKEINENTFTGTFYGSEIKNGIINQNWSKLYFAFSTADQSNDYYHSGYLENGKVYGITYCPNRGFTNPWIGTLEL